MQKSSNTFEKGLVKLDNKTKQPQNSYSFALNTVIHDSITDNTSLTNEKAFDNYLTVRSGEYVIMKAQWLGKEEYVFFIKHLEGATSEFNEIWYVDKEKDIKRLVYSNIALNFQDSYEISSTYRIDYKTNRIVYWVDGLNDDRVINVDDVDSASLDISLLSIESNYTKAEINTVVSDTGGNLLAGQYFLGLSYNLGESFTTSAFGLTNSISIGSKNYFNNETIVDTINRQFGETDGDIGGVPTRKSLKLEITNLDPNFDSINLIVIHNNHNTTTIKKVEKLSIAGLETLNYTYTGSTGVEDNTINVTDITVDSIKYYASEVIGQKENRLIRGNSKLKATGINYQAFANNIKVGYKINEELIYSDSMVNYKTWDSPISYDPRTILYKQHSISPDYLANTANQEEISKTFMRDEVYSLGVGLELIDGTETDIFHIPGRQLNTFLDNSGVGEYDRPYAANYDDEVINGNPYWLERNTALKRTGVSDLAYWESDETYSEDFDFPTGKIRHHRMPSDILEPIYSTIVTGDPNVADTPIAYSIYKRHLSLVFSNIVIPDEYKDIVKKIKIYYTPRNQDNKSILSKGLLYELKTDVSPNEQSNHFNYEFDDSGEAVSTFEFVSPEVNFKFKDTSLSASKLKVCGIDKGYVSYLGQNNPNLSSPYYITRFYNNYLLENKQREQGFMSGICFYNQRAIPEERLYNFDVNTAIFLDANFVGSSVGFGVDFTGGQKTALISLLDPITLVPDVLTDRLLNTYYPELLYPATATKPSDLHPTIVTGDRQDVLAYDTSYYVSLINENRSLYNKIESLEYINSGAYVIYDKEDATPIEIEVKTGDTYIDVHHFKKSSIFLVPEEWVSGDDYMPAYDIENTIPGESAKAVNELAFASYGSFFVETDLNIRMRREGPADNEKYFPKSFYGGTTLRDLGRMVDEEEFYKIEDGYNQHYLKLYFANTTTQEDFDRTLNNDIRYSTRLIYSDKQSLEDKTDNYRIVRVNNYRDLPLDRGPVSGLFTKQEKLYALTRDALFDIYASNQTIKSENGDNITVGTGEFFANEPTELISITGGFGGTTSKYSIVETPYGYLYVDRFKNKCLLFNEQIKDINVLGLNEDFTLELFKQIPDLEVSEFDNPIANAGIIATYDPEIKRILITKKDYKLINNYAGIFDDTAIYNVGDVVLKDGVLQKMEGIVNTEVVDTSDFSDWTIDNTNISENNMLVIDQPTKGYISSSDQEGITYVSEESGEESMTINQSGLTCGAKETVTVTNNPPVVPINYTFDEGGVDFIDNNLEFYINDVYSEGYYNEGSGTFSNGLEGHTITVLQQYYGGETDPDGNVTTPWSTPVDATLTLIIDGVVVSTETTNFPETQPAGNLHFVSFVLDHTKTYQIISSVVAKEPVTVDWQMMQNSTPYVNGDFNFYKDGVLIPKVDGFPLSGFYIGDTMEIRFFHYAENYRWPDDATGTLTVENMAETVLYTSTGGTRDINEIDNHSFVLTEDYYYIYATTDTADASLAPLGFDINNSSAVSGGLIDITAIDTTTGLTMLKVSEANDQGSYNVENDGGTQNVVINNTSGTSVTIRLRTTTATFDETYAVAAGTTVTKTGLTKAGIIIDLT